MTVAKHWTVDLYLSEKDAADDVGTGGVRTYAEARLHDGGPEEFRGHGLARKHPNDSDHREIGDELAVSRALSDLAYRLMENAAADIDAATAGRAGMRG